MTLEVGDGLDEARFHRSDPRRTIRVETHELEHLLGLEGVEPLFLDTEIWTHMFPGAATWMSVYDAARLLATTRVVGMRAPGQWSIFRQLTLQKRSTSTINKPTDSVSYRVSNLDLRFGLATVSMESSDLQMVAEVLVREPPPEQQPLSYVEKRVPKGHFQGMRALVIGGSRGLGNLTSKILVAGGAEVLFTYNVGRSESELLLEELGPSSISMQLSIGAISASQERSIRRFSPHLLAYFATPPITRQPPGTWNGRVFWAFSEVYLGGLSQVLDLLSHSNDFVSLLIPSTSFVESRPPGFSEYCSAKRAMEIMCTDWQQVNPHRRVSAPRLPPLLTDQTASRTTKFEADNLSILLPYLLELTKT
jgi:hypothetical protein